MISIKFKMDPNAYHTSLVVLDPWIELIAGLGFFRLLLIRSTGKLIAGFGSEFS